MATSKYSDIRKEKEQMTTDLFKKCGVFFAFSDKQFEENKTPLKEGEKYVSIGAGGYMPKGSFDAFRDGMKAINQLGKDKVKKGNLAETEILYELRNHECFYTSDYSDVVDMFKGTYTEKEISDVYNKHYEKESEKFKKGSIIKTNKMAKNIQALISKIKNIISEYGVVTIGELGEESILLEKNKKDEEWMIEGFNSDSVSVVKYVHGSEVADNKVTYEELEPHTLNEIYGMLKDYKGEQAKNGANIKNKKMARKFYDYDEYDLYDDESEIDGVKPNLVVKNNVNDDWSDVSVWYIGNRTIVSADDGAGPPPLEIKGKVTDKEELLCYAKGLAGSGEEGDLFTDKAKNGAKIGGTNNAKGRSYLGDYANENGTGYSKDGYHDAGLFTKEKAIVIAKKLNGKVLKDASGKYIVYFEPKAKNGANIKGKKINYAKKYPNLYNITTNFGDNEDKASWNKGISGWEDTAPNTLRANRLQLADNFVRDFLIPLGYEGIPFPNDEEEYDKLVQENVGARYLQEFHNLLDDPIRVSDYINPDDIEKDEDDYDGTDSIEDKWVTFIRVCEIAYNNDVDDAEMTEEFNELILDTLKDYGIKKDSEEEEEVSESLGLICGGSDGSAYANADYDDAVKEMKSFLKKLGKRKQKKAENGANIIGTRFTYDIGGL